MMQVIHFLTPDVAWTATKFELAYNLCVYTAMQRGRGPESEWIVVPTTTGEEPTEKKGGLNLPVVEGLHQQVYEIDFKSAYPSVMMGMNVCFSTQSEDAGLCPGCLCVDDDDTCESTEFPMGPRFRQDRIGIIPEALRSLAAKREAHPEHDGVYKLLGNSLVGVLAMSYGPMQHPHLNAVVTSVVRRALQFTNDAVDGQVVAGQTDSIFFVSDVDPDAEVTRLNALLHDAGYPLTLTLAHTHKPFLILGHHRLASLCPDLHVRGLAPQVEGSPVCIARFVETALMALFGGRDTAELHATRANAVRSAILHKRPDEYKGHLPPHALVARPQKLPRGSRVYFVDTVDGPRKPGHGVMPDFDGLKREAQAFLDKVKSVTGKHITLDAKVSTQAVRYDNTDCTGDCVYCENYLCENKEWF